MQFSTIILAALASVAIAAPAPAADAEIERAILEARACRDATYSCQNNVPSVCQFGIWMVAARCGSNQKCVQASTGGVYCIER
jgi:hypothetical protein